jgi:hypothetical protein
VPSPLTHFLVWSGSSHGDNLRGELFEDSPSVFFALVQRASVVKEIGLFWIGTALASWTTTTAYFLQVLPRPDKECIQTGWVVSVLILAAMPISGNC